MTLYMAVTSDKYELPIAIEESTSMLAKKLGRSRKGVSEEFSRLKKDQRICSGKNRGYILRKVQVDL